MIQSWVSQWSKRVLPMLAAMVVACSANPPGGSGGAGSGNLPGGRDSGAGGGQGGMSGGAAGGPTDGPPGGADAPCNLGSCASAGANCGPVGDGCGGTIDCGTCTAPDTCGGGGMPSRCGHMGCTTRTCADLGVGCGPAGDGCGGMISCGTCSAPQTCGGGGVPSQCGGTGTGDGGMMCTPRTCAMAGADCGPVADGCGGIVQCGTCMGQDSCGGGGMPSRCGHPSCTPRTCAQAGANCGPVADGCGGFLSCGTCVRGGETCGGGGTPSVCGMVCTGLCLRQVNCDAGTTTVSGIVYAPTPPQYGSPDPLPGAVVYVPNAAVTPFPTTGVSCDQCSGTASGSPLVQATSGPDGRFTLENVPAGTNVPMVIQLGRWRRQVMIPTVAPCRDTSLPTELTRLPRTKAEGDIPKIAMVTGAVDALECVLLKIGIDHSEFTSDDQNGRVHLYRENGAVVGTNTRAGTALYNDINQLRKYDLAMFACEASQVAKPAAARSNLVTYADMGGRVMATHYEYTWLYQTTPWSTTGTWDADPDLTHTPSANDAAITATVDTSFPKGATFMQWLMRVGASNGPNTISISVPRNDLDGVVAPGQRWIYSTAAQTPRSGATVQHYTFNTPQAAPIANQCGRVLFSDFHVANAGTGATPPPTFPTYCTSAPLTPQEKVIEYMIFDLTNCITPDVPPPCTPRTCAQQMANCGPVGDGCGGIIQCGTCTPPQTCGGGGVPSQCGAPPCSALTCMGQGIMCGPAGDGCGGQLDCGMCVAPDTCGGNGVPGQCGHTMSCMPRTCAQQNIECGPAGDGCGNLLQCGDCPPGQTCGGGGTPGRCGNRPCTPRTCAQANANCGQIGDGCGATLSCGMCVSPDTCGGGGVANRCGHIG